MKYGGLALMLLICISMVAAQDSGTVIRLENATEVQEIVRTGQGSIDAMALNAEETQLAVAADETVFLYDLENRDAPVMPLVMDGEIVSALEFHRVSTTLAVGTRSGKVYIWSSKTGTLAHTLEAHEEEITDLLFTVDYPIQLLVGSEDGKVTHWLTQDYSKDNTVFAANPGGIIAMGLADDNTRILTASNEVIHVWDAASGFMQDSLNGNGLTAMAVNPAAKLGVAIAAREGLILDSDLSAEGLDALLEKADGELSPHLLVFSPDGRLLAGAIDDFIEIRNPSDGALLHRIQHNNRVMALVFSEDGARLYSASLGSIAIWDTTTGERLNMLIDEFGLSEALAFSADGKYLARTNYLNGTTTVYDAATLAVVTQLPQGIATDGGVSAVTFSSDGKYMATGGNADGNSIILWDATTFEPVMALRGHTEGVRTLSFSPDSTRLLSVAGSTGNVSDQIDNRAILWDAATGEMLKEWVPHGSAENDFETYAALFAPNGAILTTSGDDKLRLWNGISFKLEGEVDTEFTPFDLAMTAQMSLYVYSFGTQGHFASMSANNEFTPPPGYVSATSASAVFNPAGDILAAAIKSDDIDKILLYDPIEQKALTSIDGQSGSINALVFSPDGTQIASTSGDGTVRLWGITGDE